MKRCLQCHAANGDNNNFCSQCGNRLNNDAMPPMPAPASPVVPAPPTAVSKTSVHTPTSVPVPSPATPLPSHAHAPAPVSNPKSLVSDGIGHVREDSATEIAVRGHTRAVIAMLLIPLLIVGAISSFTIFKRIPDRAGDYLKAVANGDYATALSMAGNDDLYANGMVPLNTLGDYMPRDNNRIVIPASNQFGVTSISPGRSAGVRFLNNSLGASVSRTLTIDASPITYIGNLITGSWRFNGLSDVLTVAMPTDITSISINGTSLDLTSLSDGCTTRTLDPNELDLSSALSLAGMRAADDEQFRVCTFLTWPGTYGVKFGDEDAFRALDDNSPDWISTVDRRDWERGQRQGSVSLLF